MENDELTLDYLKGRPDLTLYQSKEMFRINTDTCLLGEYMELSPTDAFLDVGTNNGALLLYASEKTKGLLMGIDINSKALEICQKNMELHNIDNYFLLAQDFLMFQTAIQFDVIASNPPFFNTKDDNSKNQNPYLKIARHEEYLSLETLIKGIRKNLKYKGKFFLVHRPERLEEIIALSKKEGMSIVEVVHVYDKRNGRETSILIKGVYEEKLPLIEKSLLLGGF